MKETNIKCPNCGEFLKDINLQLTCMNAQCENFMMVVYGLERR